MKKRKKERKKKKRKIHPINVDLNEQFILILWLISKYQSLFDSVQNTS